MRSREWSGRRPGNEASNMVQGSHSWLQCLKGYIAGSSIQGYSICLIFQNGSLVYLMECSGWLTPLNKLTCWMTHFTW